MPGLLGNSVVDVYTQAIVLFERRFAPWRQNAGRARACRRRHPAVAGRRSSGAGVLEPRRLPDLRPDKVPGTKSGRAVRTWLRLEQGAADPRRQSRERRKRAAPEYALASWRPCAGRHYAPKRRALVD